MSLQQRKSSIEKNIENNLVGPMYKKQTSPPPVAMAHQAPQLMVGIGNNANGTQSITGNSSPEKHKLIVWNEYEQEELIGGGSFGHVFKCRHVKTGKYYAIKKFKNKYTSKKKAFDQREIQILQRFDDIYKDPRKVHCPYVMKAERIEFENRKLYIVFEKMDMSLTQFIKKKGRKGTVLLNENNEIKIIMKQILQGLSYLNEELGILHRDLKPDNIMVNENPLIAKIIDFGTCKDLTVESGPHTSYVSTRWYRAPECVLRSHHYNFNSDVFAAGCVMSEMYLQHPLFPGTSELDQIDRIFQILGTPKKDQWREGFKLAEKREITFNDYPKRNLGKYLPGVGEEALAAIKLMLKISGQKRGNASDILTGPFFSQTNKQDYTPTTQETYSQSMQSPQFSIKAPKGSNIKLRNKSELPTSSTTLGASNLLPVNKNAHLKEILARDPIKEIIQTPSKSSTKNDDIQSKGKSQKGMAIPDQIESHLLDTIVVNSNLDGKAIVMNAQTIQGGDKKTNRYKQNKHLMNIEEETENFEHQQQLPTINVTLQSNSDPNHVSPSNKANLRSTMYKNLYGVNNTSQSSLNPPYLQAQNGQNGIIRRDMSPQNLMQIPNKNGSNQKQQSMQKSTTKSNFYQKSFYNSLAHQVQSNQGSSSNLQKSPQSKQQVKNFNSTIGFGQFQIGNHNIQANPSHMTMSDQQKHIRQQIQQNQKNLQMKFAQGTITNKFNQSRNSDVQFNNKINKQINFHNADQQQNRKPHHLKLPERFNTNLMIEANSTFMAIERSRSGIGGPMGNMISPSPLAAGSYNGQGFTNSPGHNMFNSTIQRSNRGNRNNAHSNLNKIKVPASINTLIDLNQSSSSNLHQSPIRNNMTINRPTGDYMSPKINKHSNSGIKIPMITLHNQSFLSPKAGKYGGPDAPNFSGTMYNMPNITGTSSTKNNNHNQSLTNAINSQLERGNVKLQIINEKRQQNNTILRQTLNNSNMSPQDRTGANQGMHFPSQIRQTSYAVNFNVAGKQYSNQMSSKNLRKESVKRGSN